MKFDPSIIFFLIIVFFVLPSVLKKIRIRKKIKNLSDASVLSETSLVSGVSGMKTEAKTGDEFEKVNKNSSILGKVVMQIRQFIQEAYKLAEEQRQLQQQNNVNLKNKQGQNYTENLTQAGEDQNTIWDILAEKTDDDFDESGGLQSEKTGCISEEAGCISEEKFSIKENNLIVKQTDKGTLPDRKYHFKTDPLQNAVIWSEILSKPVALKDNLKDNY